MPIEGPNSPGTMAEDSSVGTITWSNVDDAKTSNDIRATANFSSPFEQTHYLKATNFSFAIPNATILGIQVSVERKSSDDTIDDVIIRLVKGGSVQGNNKSSGDTWPSIEASKTFGGISDLWGLSFTASDINASNFGVVVSAEKPTGMSGDTAAVDHITITVTYAFEINVFDTVVVDDSFAATSFGQLLLSRTDTISVGEFVDLAFNPLLASVADSIVTADFADNFFDILHVEVVDDISVADAGENLAFNPILISVFDTIGAEDDSNIAPHFLSQIVSRIRVRSQKFRKKLQRQRDVQHTGQFIKPPGQEGKLQPLRIVTHKGRINKRREPKITLMLPKHTGESAPVLIFIQPSRLRVKVMPSARQDPRKTRRRKLFQQASGHYTIMGPMRPVFFTGLTGLVSTAKGVGRSVNRGVMRGTLRGVM